MNWRNLHDHDCFLFARSYHTAAKKLAGALDMEPGPLPDFEVCPVLSTYRQAIELHLKLIVLGDGGNFLPTKPDELSVQKTRSLSWLAQFVCQIITRLQWEDEFTTEGVNDLAGFKAVIEEANGIDAHFRTFRCPANPERPEAVKAAVFEFLRRLDAVLELLAQTADALAAEWDLRSDPTALESDWPSGNTTIH